MRAPGWTGDPDVARRQATASSTASENGAAPSGVGSIPREVVHDRVADERRLEDVAPIDLAARASSAVSFARHPRPS